MQILWNIQDEMVTDSELQRNINTVKQALNMKWSRSVSISVKLSRL